MLSYVDVATTTTPDGSSATVLDDRGGYLEVADSPDLSIATTGQFTVEMLLRPDVVTGLPDAEPSSEGAMVAPLVKGSTFGAGGDQEYAMRLYDQDSSRPSPTSAYAFDPAGGQGAGSYAQDGLEAGQWVHLAAVYDTKTKGGDGWGTVTLYRDGVEVDADTLGGDHEITPADGASPLFIGGDGARSAFTGAIGPVVIYPTALTGKQVAAHVDAALTPHDDQGKDAHESKDTGKDDDGAGKDDGSLSPGSGPGWASCSPCAGTTRPRPRCSARASAGTARSSPPRPHGCSTCAARRRSPRVGDGEGPGYGRAVDAGDPRPTRPPARRRWAQALIWLPAVVWVVGTPLTAAWSLAYSLTFFGEQPSAQQVQATRNTMIWAAVCSAGAPLAGLGLAGLARSSRALRLYAVALVIGCLPGLGWLALDAHRTPVPVERVTTCQEHSGSDNRCPGG